MRFLLGLLLLAGSAKSAVYFRLPFENNLTDSNGVTSNAWAVGSGPSYVTTVPLAAVGTYSARGMTDANYITLNAGTLLTSADAVTLTGSIAIDYRATTATANGKVLWTLWNGAIDGFLWVQGDGTVYHRAMTTGGFFNFNSSAGEIQAGRWYTLTATYSPQGISIYAQDQSCDTARFLATASGYTGYPKYSIGGSGYGIIGKYGQAGGYAAAQNLDNFTIYDNKTTVSGLTKPQYVIVSFGHSIMAGYGCAGCCQDGWRTQGYQNLYQHGYNATFGGQTVYGTTCEAPYTDAISGAKSIDVLNVIQAKLAADFKQASSRQIVILGSTAYNDNAANVTLTVYSANVDAQINSINASSPLRPILMVNEISNGNFPQYRTAFYNSYLSAKAAGKNVFYCDASTQNISLCVDNVHPDPAGYITYANFITSNLESQILNPASSTPPNSFMGMLRLLFFPDFY